MQEVVGGVGATTAEQEQSWSSGFSAMTMNGAGEAMVESIG